MLLIYSD